MRKGYVLLVCALLALTAGCATISGCKTNPPPNTGGYYDTDLTPTNNGQGVTQ
jgi:hypothetical protein